MSASSAKELNNKTEGRGKSIVGRNLRGTGLNCMVKKIVKLDQRDKSYLVGDLGSTNHYSK